MGFSLTKIWVKHGFFDNYFFNTCSKRIGKEYNITFHGKNYIMSLQFMCAVTNEDIYWKNKIHTKFPLNL